MKPNKIYLSMLLVALLFSVGLGGYFIGKASISTTDYYLDTPLPVADYYIGKYSNGSYFAINGSNWDNFEVGSIFQRLYNHVVGNASANGGGHVVIGDGLFQMSSISTYGRMNVESNVHIEGMGHNTVVKAPSDIGALSGALQNPDFASTGNYNITIKNIRFDGNNASQTLNTTSMIFLRGVHNVWIKNCWFENVRQHGVRISGEVYNCSNCHLIDNWSSGTGYNFCVFNDVVKGSIRGNYVEYADTGISVWSAIDVEVTDNIIFNMTNQWCFTHGGSIEVGGTTTEQSYNLTICNNIIDYANTGISVKYTHQSQVNDNFITRCWLGGAHGNGGVKIESTAYNTQVFGNYIQSCDDGILVGGKYCEIGGNWITDSWNTKQGIEVTGTYNHIFNNHIVDNTAYGIVISGKNNILEGNYIKFKVANIGIWIKATADNTTINGGFIYNATTGILFSSDVDNSTIRMVTLRSCTTTALNIQGLFNWIIGCDLRYNVDDVSNQGTSTIWTDNLSRLGNFFEAAAPDE